MHRKARSRCGVQDTSPRRFRDVILGVRRVLVKTVRREHPAPRPFSRHVLLAVRDRDFLADGDFSQRLHHERLTVEHHLRVGRARVIKQRRVGINPETDALHVVVRDGEPINFKPRQQRDHKLHVDSRFHLQAVHFRLYILRRRPLHHRLARERRHHRRRARDFHRLLQFPRALPIASPRFPQRPHPIESPRVFSQQFVPRAFARPVPLARASRQALQRAPRRRLRRSSTRLSHPRARAFERLDGVREFQALFVSERRAARRARDARARAEAQRLKRPRAVALALLRAQRRGVRLRGHYARAGGDRSRRAHAALVRNGAVARARDVEALERARHRDGAE